MAITMWRLETGKGCRVISKVCGVSQRCCLTISFHSCIFCYVFHSFCSHCWRNTSCNCFISCMYWLWHFASCWMFWLYAYSYTVPDHVSKLHRLFHRKQTCFGEHLGSRWSESKISRYFYRFSGSMHNTRILRSKTLLKSVQNEDISFPQRLMF